MTLRGLLICGFGVQVPDGAPLQSRQLRTVETKIGPDGDHGDIRVDLMAGIEPVDAAWETHLRAVRAWVAGS
jgi:hypothetical protein